MLGACWLRFVSGYVFAPQPQGPLGGWEAISVSASILALTRNVTVFVLVPPDPFGRPGFLIGSRAVSADVTLLSAIAGT